MILDGKVSVVTGGASGIGRALATRCRDEGMQVVIADVEAEVLERTAAELGVHPVLTDVGDAASVEHLRNEVVERFGTCHLLCNNAGVGGGGKVADLTLADWRWVVDVNLWGVVHGLTAFLPLLLGNEDGGHVVNTASVAGLGPFVNAPYTATKYAVVGISETLRKELAGTGVGVSVLCPGVVRTNIFTSQRNRPAELRNERSNPGARATNAEAAREMLSAGMDPLEVARQVLDAVVADRFWVVTHPEVLALASPRYDELRHIAEGIRS